MADLTSIAQDVKRNWNNHPMTDDKIFFEVNVSADQSQFNPEIDKFVCNHIAKDQILRGAQTNFADQQVDYRVHSATPNFREEMISTSTKDKNRERLFVCGLSYAFFDGDVSKSLEEICDYINSHQLKLYTAETMGTLFVYLRSKIKPELFYCSEYLGDEHRSGQVVKGVLHEDLQNMSFKDNFFDIILTAEVMEHVPNAPIAEAEIIRVLKPGGCYCFTAPFRMDLPHDQIKAELGQDGQITYHAEPEYHPALYDERGSLVFRVFSQVDLYDRFTKLGCDFKTLRLWSLHYGMVGPFNFVHVIRKSEK